MDANAVTKIDKYIIKSKIGSGSFGDVYRAVDERLLREVAIKKVPSNEGSLMEFEILKSIDYEGLPRIYDFIEMDDDLYIVMELMEGISLREYLDKEGTLNEAIAMGFFCQLIDIISVLHHRHPAVIYRDLKPENIIISPDGKLKLIDFGAAFFRDYSGEDGRECYGTKGYSAPEVWLNKVAGPQADIYSMGIILYEMLSGERPDRSPYSISRVRCKAPMVTRKTEDVILRCVANNPQQRYNSLEELKEAINQKDSKETTLSIAFIALRVLVWTGIIFAFVIAMIEMLNNGIWNMGVTTLGNCLVIIGLSLLLRQKVIRGIIMGNRRIKVVKRIHLTSKKYAGLYMGVFFGIGIIMGLCLGAGETVNAYADTDAKDLWVEMKDVSERKLLLRDDSIYEVSDKVRLEIPSDSMPQDRMSIEIVAVGEDGTRYESRRFNVIK